MINVLFIVNELRYTCGVTNHIIHLSRALTESGEVKLYIISGGGNGSERFQNTDAEILTDKRFNHKNRSLPSYLKAGVFLSNFARKNKIQIVHSHSHYAANIACKASSIAGFKTVQTNHGLLQTGGRLKHFNAEKYIAVNEHIYDYIIKHTIAKAEDVYLIRCGIPFGEKVSNNTNNKLKVIAASRFAYEKGLDVFINAVAKLDLKTRHKAEFIIAGEGELELSLQKLNKQTGAEVFFPGSIRNMDTYLQNTHILVYPSRSESEGFPAVITEAAACRNLVISSDFYGADCVIEHNKEGLIFRKDDASSLAEKLSLAIENYETLKILADNFYNKAKELFSIETMKEKHLKLYNALITGCG